MTDISPDVVGAWRALMLVHAKVTGELDRVLRTEVGIPVSWYEALVEIAFAGGSMTMSRFARETTLTKSGATRFVDRLERAGLVARASGTADRRLLELSLTDEGREIQRRADPHVLAVIDRLFASQLDGAEARTLRRALTRIGGPTHAGLPVTANG